MSGALNKNPVNTNTILYKDSLALKKKNWSLYLWNNLKLELRNITINNYNMSSPETTRNCKD